MKNWRGKLLPLVVTLASAVFVLLLAWAGIFRGLDYLLQDLLVPARGTSGEIVIVAIDNESIASVGQWPWPRAAYSKFIDSLQTDPPKSLGFDVLFAEPSRAGSQDDAQLAESLTRATYPVVLATEGTSVVPLPKFLTNPKVSTGDVHLLVDPDGVVRWANVAGSFAEKLAGNSAARPPSGGRAAGNERIAYAGPPGTFRRVSFARVLSDASVRKELAGKVVLVGATATDLHDEQRTPLDRGVAMPGVEIQANITSMLTSGVYTKELPALLVALIVLLAALLVLICFSIFSSLLRSLIATLIVSVFGLVGIILLFDQNFILPVIYPALAWFLSAISLVLWRYFGAERDRREMRTLFGKYLSTDVLEELLRDPSQVKLGGEEREVTVLFSDVRGFTSFSESMSAVELTAFLNRYLTVMTDIILAHGGVIDKYIGDAIMAYWGAPVRRADHALSALSTAVVMSGALGKLNVENKKLGVPEIEIGVGLNSGLAVAGNMGSRERFDYTLMGDTVNLSSRLEGLTKYYGVRIVASGVTVDEARKLARKGAFRFPEASLSWQTREIDQARVKGKKESVRIFEIYGDARASQLEPVKSDFDKARELYYAGKWQEATTVFKKVLASVPTDGPTKLLLERCEHFWKNPPTDWRGVYEHTSK